SVFVQIPLLQAQGLVARQARLADHEIGDAALDQGHEFALGRVQGVVEIEHPVLDMGEVGPRGAHAVTMVPAPWPVNSSTSMACGRRPSRMTTASTPASTAATAVCSLGIMPPVATPSSIRPRASATVIWRIRRP